MPLRPYQSECLAAIVKADAEGCRRQLIALPTGTGKTRVASELPAAIELSAWETMVFLVAQEELAWQSMASLQECNPTLRVSLEKATHRVDINADIIVASIDTLSRSEERLAAFAQLPLRVVFIDECHGAVSPKYMKVLAALRVLKDDPNCDEARLLIGLTATPKRHDGVALGRIFDRIVYRRSIKEMVEAKWIADPIAYRVNANVDLSDVALKKGDFATGDLSAVMNTPRVNTLVVQKYLEYGAGLSAIGFTVDIQHSNDLAETFRHHGLDFHAISSETKDGLRKELIEAHRNMEIQGLVSCLDTDTEVLTAGGWKGHSQVTASDLVANWHDDGAVTFELPSEVIVRDRGESEQMIVFRSEHADIRVTGNHRMVRRYAQNVKWHVSAASELTGRRNLQIPCSGHASLPIRSWAPEQPRKRSVKDLQVMANATAYNLRNREGYDMASSRLEATRRTARRYSMQFSGVNNLTIDECRLIGFWAGDGCKSDGTSGGVIYNLSQAIRSKHIVYWIDLLLSRLGIAFSRLEQLGKGNDSDHVTWNLPKGTGGGSQECAGIFHITPYLQRQDWQYLWALKEDQFLAWLQGFWLAEGDHTSGDTELPDKRFTSIHNTDYGLLSVLQAICTCLGYRANLQKDNRDTLPDKPEKWKQRYYLTIIKQSKTTVGGVRGVLPYAEESWKPEKVWCVTVPSGMIIVRRNGKVAVTGNCQALLTGFDSPPATVALFARPTCSSLLYTQALGRVLRPYPAPEAVATHTGYVKKNAVVIDFVGASAAHRLYTASTLFGLHPDFDMKGRSITKTVKELEEVQRQNPTLDISQYPNLADVKAAAVTVNLWKPAPIPKLAKSCSAFIWVEHPEDTYRLSAPGISVYLEVDHLGRHEVWSERDNEKPSERMQFDEPEDAFSFADSLVPEEMVKLIRANASWRRAEPSEAQCSLLWRMDSAVHKQFANPGAFHHFACGQTNSGNGAFSRGSLSLRIDMAKRVTKERQRA